jgi:hypothetical protein
MDFRSFDESAVKAVVTCELRGTRFFISESGCATDIPERAKTFRELAGANLHAIAQKGQWHGEFDWEARNTVHGELV